MPKRATMIVLNEQEQEGLLQITRRHRSEQHVVLRARIVLAAAQGHPNRHIANELGINVVERHDIMVGVACILLAMKLFEKVQSQSDVEDEVGVINSLRQAPGEEQIAQLLAQIEPHAQQIVDEALSKP